MEAIAVQVSTWAHRAEEMKLPFISGKTVAIGAAIGIPVAILLQDTAKYWLPVEHNIPIISWFVRKWRKDPDAKETHVRLIRNAIIFLFIAVSLNESTVKLTPLEFVSDRVTSSTARSTLTHDIQRSRQASFAIANDIITDDMMNPAVCEQQRDSALRRRYNHDALHKPMQALDRQQLFDPWRQPSAVGLLTQDIAALPPMGSRITGSKQRADIIAGGAAPNASLRRSHSSPAPNPQHINQTGTTFDNSSNSGSTAGGNSSDRGDHDAENVMSAALIRAKMSANSPYRDASASTASAGLTAPSRSRESDGRRESVKPANILFEMLVPIHSKLQDREEVLRSLGVWVTTSRGGTNGLSRVVNVKLTDPTDPFFLFEMELAEDDYGMFKHRLELLVDFAGFPKYLVSMLHGVVAGSTPYLVSFVVDRDDTTRGTFRVLEKTDFRTVEHVSLNLIRQGDVGQKRYLAERFQHFEQAFLHSEATRKDETNQHDNTVADLRDRLQAALEERDSLSERLKLTATMAQSEQLSTISRLKEEHTAALESLRAKMEAEHQLLSGKYDATQRHAMEEQRTRDASIEELRQKSSTLESTLVALRSQLRLLQDKDKAQSDELKELRRINEELAVFRQDATRSLSDTHLSYVTTAERLRSAEESLRVKEQEVASLRDQNTKQDGYVRMLSDETNALRSKLDETDASQRKAHYIISKQLEKIRVSKDRERTIQDRMNALDRLIDEKNKAEERLRADLSTAAERYEILLQKANELRDQLSRTDEERMKLADELRLSQEALVHLQRNTSVGGRHWGALASTGAPSSSSAYMNPSSSSVLGGYTGSAARSASTHGVSNGAMHPSFDIYKEFTRNVSMPGMSSGGIGNTNALGRTPSTFADTSLPGSHSFSASAIPPTSVDINRRQQPSKLGEDVDVQTKLFSDAGASDDHTTKGMDGGSSTVGYDPSRYARSSSSAQVQPSKEQPLFGYTSSSSSISPATAPRPPSRSDIVSSRGDQSSSTMYDQRAYANTVASSAYFKRS